MSDEIIELTISPDGRVQVRVEGVEGTACLAHTQDLIARLGGEVESHELTAEAYVETGEEQRERQWQ